MVIVEQSLNVALAVADRAIFMEKGEIRFDGPARELAERDDLARAVFLGGADPVTDRPPRLEVPTQVLLSGAMRGLAIGVMAVGMILIYRSCRVINFALGELGALCAALFVRFVVNWHWNFYAALVAHGRGRARSSVALLELVARPPAVPRASRRPAGGDDRRGPAPAVPAVRAPRHRGATRPSPRRSPSTGSCSTTSSCEPTTWSPWSSSPSSSPGSA